MVTKFFAKRNKSYNFDSVNILKNHHDILKEILKLSAMDNFVTFSFLIKVLQLYSILLFINITLIKQNWAQYAFTKMELIIILI